MDSIIEIYARMVLEGDWEESRIPPQLKKEVEDKITELKLTEEYIEGGE